LTSLGKCNYSECENKDSCARYTTEYEEDYNFKAIKKFWNCCVKKVDEGEENGSK